MVTVVTLPYKVIMMLIKLTVYTNCRAVPTWGELVHALETERDACGRSCLHVCAIAKPNPLRKQQKRAPSGNSSLLPIRGN